MSFLLVVGFISILGQVVLLRELSVAFYGVELIYTLAIGTWLLWTAAGAMISRRSLQPSLLQISIVFVLFSLILPLDVAFIRSVRLLFSGVPGAYLPFQIQILAMALSLMPVGLMLGLLFQWTAKVYLTGERSLAFAYAIESLGGLAGGLCATLFLKFGFQNFWIALLCSLIAAGTSLLYMKGRGRRLLQPITLVFLGLLMVFFWKAKALDHLMTSWSYPNMTATRDSPYCRITVTRSDNQISVFENDALSFETQGTNAEEFVHLAALQHPNPTRILALGGGVDGTILEILKHSPQLVDYVEVNRTLLDLVVPHLSLEVQDSLRAPNVRTIIADPRRFLDQTESYDLILIGMPEPTSGQANRFFTQEFFQQCSSRLNREGVIAFRLQSAENYWTPQLSRRMVSIYRAAKLAFSDVLFLPGRTNVVIGSKQPLTRDLSLLTARFHEREIKARLISEAYIRYLYQNDRVFQIAERLESGIAPANSDVRPICYQYTILIWLSKFFPSINSWNFSFLESPDSHMIFLYWITAVGLAAFFALSRMRWPLQRALLMGVAGFIGMILETLLILHYQVKQGILYQDLGLLLMVFMAGLALGAIFTDQAYCWWAGKQRISKVWGASLLLGFILLSAFVGFEVNSGRSAGLVETSMLLLLTGFFVAGIFAYASLSQLVDQRKIITLLYSSDLIGGCFGSLLGSLALIPIVGLGTTAQLMVPLAVISALLL